VPGKPVASQPQVVGELQPRNGSAGARYGPDDKRRLLLQSRLVLLPNRMIAVVPVTPQNVHIFKAVRLRALQDAPYAFSATYAKESQFTDAEWMERTIRWNGEKGIGFLAMDDGAPCGIAGSFLDPEDATRAQLVSMWTAPAHRQRGVGRLLVNEVIAWAGRRGACILRLMVTSNNDLAILFYERLGFTRTGRTEPYLNDPAVMEYEMSRPVP
jgi:ribosomal protein S18 acetylase RimI-like enzyme